MTEKMRGRGGLRISGWDVSVKRPGSEPVLTDSECKNPLILSSTLAGWIQKSGVKSRRWPVMDYIACIYKTTPVRHKSGQGE